MTVSTVMQLQKHQPGSRRFTILVGDSQGQQHIAVMTGQMLAGEVGLPVSATPRMPVEPVISLKILLLSRSFRV